MPDQIKHLYLLAEFGPEGYRIEKGLAMDVHSSVRGRGFYPAGISFATDFDTAMEERIERAMRLGLINRGKFDDRKPRFSGIRRENGAYMIAVGPTHFLETVETNAAAIDDREVYERLRHDGKDLRGDPRAYFSNMIAVETVPVSGEGHVLVFQRSGKVDLYPHNWQGYGGLVDTDFSFWSERNPSFAFRRAVDTRALKEADEEGGILPSEIALSLTGLVDSLSTVNFTYIGDSLLPAEEMIRRRRGAEDAGDHTDEKILKTPGEVHDFLLSDYPLAPVSLGAMLLYLKKEDMDAFESVKRRFSQYPLVFEGV